MSRFLSAAVALIAFGLSTPAFAQATRTWVSGVGDDVNPCSRTAPCKTFAGAISKTAPKGEISALDPGGFGAVTITKSVTISGDATLAGIANSGTNGITVAAQPTDVVILRNLSIGGAGIGTNGIRFTGGGTLVVDKVSIYAQSGADIDVALAPAAVGSLIVKDSTLTGGTAGVKIESGVVASSLNHVSIYAAAIGVDAIAGVVEVSNSVIVQSSGFGLYAEGGSIDVESTMLTGNLVAVQAQTGSTVRLSNSDLFNNLTGFGCGGGLLASAQDNRKAGNVGGIVPVCLPTAAITIQ